MPRISEVVRLYFGLLCLARMECSKDESWNAVTKERYLRAKHNFRCAAKSFARHVLTRRDLCPRTVHADLCGRFVIVLRDGTRVAEEKVISEITNYLQGR